MEGEKIELYIYFMLPFSLGIIFTYRFIAAIAKKEKSYIVWVILSGISLGFGITMLSSVLMDIAN